MGPNCFCSLDRTIVIHFICIFEIGPGGLMYYMLALQSRGHVYNPLHVHASHIGI